MRPILATLCVWLACFSPLACEFNNDASGDASVTTPGGTQTGDDAGSTTTPTGTGSGDASSPVYSGTLTVRDDRDITLLASIETITGSLVIATNAIATLNLATITKIDGDLIVSGPKGLQSLTLPALSQVGGSLRIEDTNGLTTVAFPALKRIGAELSVSNNADLTELALTALAETGGAVALDNNAVLSAFSLLKLAKAPAVSVHDNALLQTITLGLNAPTSTLSIAHNDALTLISLPLAEALSSISVDGVVDGDDARSVSQIALPKLSQIDELEISNCALTNLDLPLLASAMTLRIEQNAQLSTLTLPQLSEVDTLIVQTSGTLRLPKVVNPSPDSAGRGFAHISVRAAGFEAPLLNSASSLNLELDGAESLQLPALTLADHVELSSQSLASVSMPKLATVTELYLQWLPALSSLQLGAISELWVLKVDSTGLKSWALPSLTSAGSVTFSGNYAMKTLDLSSLGTANTIRLGASNAVTDPSKSALSSLRLDGLVSVAEELRIQYSTNLTTLAIGKLKSVPTLTIEGIGASSLNLSSLTSVESLRVRRTQLQSLAFPLLTAAATEWIVEYNTQLSTVSVPQLKSVGKLACSYNSVLTQFSAPLLSSAVDITLLQNAELQGFSVDALKSVTKTNSSATGRFQVINNVKLLQFSAAQLASAKILSISDNDLLNAFALPKFVAAEVVTIHYNTKLYKCYTDGLQTQMLNAGSTATFSISSNSSYTGSCN